MKILFSALSDGIYGGVKKTYEVAENLFAMGHDVNVWAPNGIPNWFDFNVPVIKEQPHIADVLVVSPKWSDLDISTFGRKVCYVGGRRNDLGYDPDRSNVDLNICVSKWVAQAYKHFNCPSKVVPLGFDLNLYKFVPFHQKERNVICYMPRKNGFLVDRIMQFIHPKIRDKIKLLSIENFDEKQVAQTFQISSIFLALSTWDGFPLPPMEAMLCGTLVVGFLAGGGSEYLQPEINCIAVNGPVSPKPIIEDQDLRNFAKSLTRTIHASENKIRREARKLAEEYTLQREASSWSEALELLFVNNGFKT